MDYLEHLEDELDLRYHKGLNPEVYYRCPTLESLEGALRNELDKNAASFIPTHVVTEFIFATASTITIPVSQQPSLDVLIEPANFLQSLTVEYALCRDMDAKDRLKVQRAITRSIIEAISAVDRFKYIERHADNKGGRDGVRFKYICQDSFQNRHRKSNMKKEKPQESDDSDAMIKKLGPSVLPTFDCGGAIHVKFSLKREAINVVYKHNPIHIRQSEDSLPALATENGSASQAINSDGVSEKKQRKRKRTKDQIDVDDAVRDLELDASTLPEAPKSSAKKKSKKSGAPASPEASRKASADKSKKAKQATSPAESRKKALVSDPPTPAAPIKNKACIRCRETKIKCNQAKPTCDQCQRGLWTCQYEIPGIKKRSKLGCVNCKQRKRKCTEERPSCAHCMRIDDDCDYGDYS